MTVMIIFATVEGQTRKIAGFIADQLRATGNDVVMNDAERTEPLDFDGVERVILCAPVHERRHPRKFEALVSGHIAELQALPTLLLSVSLSAAFEEGLEDARDYLTEMEMRTDFTPTRDACIAGAVRTGEYDYYATQIIRHVVMRGHDYDPDVKVHEFTDWFALARTVTDFLAVSPTTARQEGAV